MADEPSLQMVMEILLDLQQSQRRARDETRDEIAALRDEMRERFDRLEARMDRLEARMDHLESGMGRLEARQDAMEALLRQHTRRLDSLTFDVSNIRRDLGGLRVEVRDYHGAVIGHGLQITELDERVRRIEEHLGLSRM
jgi:chromosome segregation ATPase